MAWKPAQLDEHLATAKALKPVYLLAGDEHLMLFEAADALRRRARELGFSEREVYEAESGFDWNDLARAGASLSLFASQRLIDLRLPTGRPGAEGMAAITAMLDSPPPDTVLLITSPTWSKSHETSWVNAVAAVGPVVVYWPLKPPEMPDWIARRATRAGLKLTPDAVGLLVERMEGNLLAAAQEIDKLVLLAHGRALDASALDALVADNARFDVFRLVDVALAGETARAVHIVAALRAEGDAVPGLIGPVAMALSTLVRAAALVERGQSIDAALRAEHVWQAKIPVYRAALRRGGFAYWESRLAEAARVERIGKGRADGDAWRDFERLLAAMSDPRLARAMAPA
jgi:DNA polymerase-3 subunit delta